MSVFVFDTDTLDMIRYMLALEHFKKYSIGPQGLNEHLCALSLERVLIQTGLKFPQFQKANPREIRLYDIVRFLQQKHLVSPTIANELSQYVDFHDSLIQKGSQTTATEKANKAQEILRFLCTEASINQEMELKNRTFQEIANLTKKPPAVNQTCEILESDFDNLEQLYEKCAIIQQEIQRGLKTPLRGAQISGFTPNTGGIWIPFVTTETAGNRGHKEKASLGVTFTPADITIGLNFGTQAHKYRIKYYELLLNGELTDELESLNRKATGYCFCDTFWYYHIRNIQSLQWGLTLYSSTKVAIEGAIEDTKRLEGTPLTANQYLIAKVIKRRPEDFTYITRGLVNEISTDLNELYPILARIDKI